MAALAVTALLAAGCSSGDSSGEDFTSDLTGDPIKVMQIYSGNAKGFTGFTYAAAGAQAAADAINDAGGINGRPLVLDACDDGFDPNRAGECARKAVSEDVVAVVGAYSGLGDNWMPILERAGIPCIGCAGYSNAESTSPMYYPIGSSAAAHQLAAGLATCALGAENPAVIYVDHNAGRFLAAQYAKGLEKCGLTAKKVPIDQEAADYAPQIAQATDGTDLVAVIAGQPAASKLMAGAAAQGKTPTWIGQYSATREDFFTAAPSLLNNAYVTSPVIPAQIDVPETRQFNEEIAKYAADPENLAMVDPTVIAWAAVHIAAQLLEPLDEANPESLLALMKTQGSLQFGPTSVVDWTSPIEAFKPVMEYSPDVYVAKVGPKAGQFVPVFEGGFIDVTGGVPTHVNN